MAAAGVRSAPLSLRSNRLYRYSSGASVKMKDILKKELDGIREAGTWKTERVITSPQAASIRVQGQDKSILNFCANNYLGLSVSFQSFVLCHLIFCCRVEL